MTDSVPFKVYLTTTIQPPEVRRFTLTPGESTSLTCVTAKLRQIFPQLLSTASFSVCWQDGDGDLVVVRRDEELQIALTELAHQLPYRLYVTIDEQQKLQAGQSGQEEDKVTGEEEQADWTSQLIHRINKLQKKCEAKVVHDLGHGLGLQMPAEAGLSSLEVAARQQVTEACKQLEEVTREAVIMQCEAVQGAVKKTSEEAKRLAENPREMVGNVAEVVAAIMEPLVLAMRAMATEYQKQETAQSSGSGAETQSSGSGAETKPSGSSAETKPSGSSQSIQLMNSVSESPAVKEDEGQDEWTVIQKESSYPVGQSTAAAADPADQSADPAGQSAAAAAADPAGQSAAAAADPASQSAAAAAESAGQSAATTHVNRALSIQVNYFLS